MTTQQERSASSAVVPAPRIRILIVDDDTLAREGVSAILRTTTDLEVVGHCSDGSQLNDSIAQTRPDVVLMDVRMPVVDGVTAVQLAQGLAHPPRFLMMTAFDDDGRVLDALAAGASGFLLKDEDPSGIIDAVRSVAGGESAFSARSAGHLVRWVRSSDTLARRGALDQLALLSDRERDIATAVASGLSDAELAEKFFVAESTVKSTLGSIKTKWGVRNRTQIAVIVVRSGIV